MTTAKEALEQDLAEQRRMGAFLLTPPGELLLKRLEDVYYHGDLIGTTVEETYKNLGARDVVRHLRDLRGIAQKET